MITEGSSRPDSLDPGVALEGQVISGRGLASLELLTLREQLQTIVKEPLCPGSLNIVLNHPVRLVDAAGFAFDLAYRTLWRGPLARIELLGFMGREFLSS